MLTADWQDKASYWVKNTSPYSFQINKIIDDALGKVRDLHKTLCDQKEHITLGHVDELMGFEGDRSIFNDYFRNYMKNPPPTVQITTDVTWEKYDGFIKQLDKYNPALRFREINLDEVARIRNFIAQQPGVKAKYLAPATVKSYFDKFKVVLEHAAKKDNLLSYQKVQEFFQEVTVTVPDKEEGQHLDIREVKSLREMDFGSRYPSRTITRDIFLFMIYTGFYYLDVKNFRRGFIRHDHEVGYYLLGKRNKNGKPNIIPLYKFPNANEIMARYEDPNPDSEFFFRRDIFCDPQLFNRNLKQICKDAGIVRWAGVSGKTARCTNMQLWIRMGVNSPVVSRFAGHSNDETIKHYYKISIGDVITAAEGVDISKLGI